MYVDLRLSMAREFLESDWKVFRELREVALDRFCKQTLDRIEKVCNDRRKTNRERYLAVAELLKKQDKEIATMFDGARRSTMLWQLRDIHSHHMIRDEEIERFSEELRTTAGNQISISWP